MKPVIVSTTVRPSARFLAASHPAITTPFLLPQRSYATQHTLGGGAAGTSSSSKRRAVTPFNDDGHVPWTQLSAGEKTARAAQQTVNFGLVMLGLVLTGGVGYFLYTDIFSPDSKVAYFNRAVDRIKKDPRCVELLGPGNKIVAYGEETYNKWRRARPIASTETRDPQGNEHLLIHFNVEGPKNKGAVNIHLTKPAGHHEYEYRYFFVDVRGQQRIYLENAEGATQHGSTKRNTKLFGINWGS
ncbi:hypothetical protein NKR23_g9875 [Pleurostoma richardsiae]|uniref:Mitochondrial import inner membrane translocase subunit Tim21 n=1 Tax=Pleurostoma richardsiae TaxID=41990 RepID=A0AA38VMI1_9PEZI|nr:hypothetical protein NKR23_g9875 [Pleurostoma richardsiae]